MRERKQTLPQHTILAGNGSRIGAFLIDMFSWLILAGLFFVGSNAIFSHKANELNGALDEEKIATHLYYEDGDTVSRISGSNSFNEIKDALVHFYFTYAPSAEHDVHWFNKEVLRIDSNDPDNDAECYFTYEKNGTEYDMSKIGVLKGDDFSVSSNANKTMQNAIVSADSYFFAIPEIQEMSRKIAVFYTVEGIVCSSISALIIYCLIPFILKNGQTFGKKAFGLGLASGEGYMLNQYQLLLRVIPFVLSNLVFLLPIFADLFGVMLFIVIMLLSSFALSMASPKKKGIHDYVANTIVIDYKKSKIFASDIEEQEYQEKEDNEQLKDD